MLHKILCYFFLLVLLVSTHTVVYAQQVRTLTDTITDGLNNTLESANVLARPAYDMSVSYLGYQSQNMEITGACIGLSLPK